MADGGLSVALLIGSTVASTGASLVAQKSAENAAEAQSKSQQNLLERRAENQRQALAENTKRQLENKRRQLARVRLNQAASGFNTTSGTALAVFGDIEDSLDQQIEEQTNQALDAYQMTRSQQANLAYGDQVRRQAGGINRMAIGIQGVTNFASGYQDNYDRYGSDPFGILKKTS